MAYGIVHTFPGGTKSSTRHRSQPCIPATGSLPEGQLYHAAGPSEGGWTITAVHDSRESWERFRDGILMPAMERGVNGGFTSPPTETGFEIYKQMP